MLYNLQHKLHNSPFMSCLSPPFQSESLCEALYMKIIFIHTQMNQNLHVNQLQAIFHMKGFAPGLALKQK